MLFNPLKMQTVPFPNNNEGPVVYHYSLIRALLIEKPVAIMQQAFLSTSESFIYT